MHAVKMIDAEEGRVGGYLVIWGDPAQRDLQGEYFTPATDLGLDWYPQRPVLYHHGLDGHVKAAVIGVMETFKVDATGLWVEAQLDLRQQYAMAVQRLIDRGVLGWSSGSLPHLVEVAADGHIKRWPIVEGSLTPTPAEPRQPDVRTIKSAYDALGLDPAPLCLDDNEKGNTPMQHNENTTPAQKRLPMFDTGEATKTRIEVGSPYDSLDALDLMHGYMLLRAGKSFQGVSEHYANALAHKVTGAGIVAGKANELSHSTQVGFGDEWVPDLWSQQIWQKARQDNVILPLFRSIEMPSNPFELPVEGTDPSVFLVPETTDETNLSLGSGNPIPESKVGSGKVQLSAKKLALRVGFSAELVEDAIVPVLSIYREQAMRAIADSIDHVLLNGDTTGDDTNINVHEPIAPASTNRYLAFDGLRHLPLVGNTANATQPAATFALSDMRTTRFLMANRYAARPNDLAWIVDTGTYAQILGFSEFLTMDKAGSMATAMTGQIGFVDGAPVVVSAEMPLTGTDGKVSATNDKGTALCVYRPGWFVGYRRRIAVNVDYLPYYDSYQLTATVRLAFGRFDDEVASALTNI